MLLLSSPGIAPLLEGGRCGILSQGDRYGIEAPGYAHSPVTIRVCGVDPAQHKRDRNESHIA